MKQQKGSASAAEEARRTSLLLMMVLFEVCGYGEPSKIEWSTNSEEKDHLLSHLFHKVIPLSWKEHQEKTNGS